jgi:ribonuclease HI
MTICELTFDGGSKGNPGHGYGSFRLTCGGEEVALERLDYGATPPVTNNQAEYLTLIHGLQRLRAHRGTALAETTVVVRGDSQLVINQVLGRWKVNNLGLQPLQKQARELLTGFACKELLWHARANSVRVLGH